MLTKGVSDGHPHSSVHSEPDSPQESIALLWDLRPADLLKRLESLRSPKQKFRPTKLCGKTAPRPQTAKGSTVPIPVNP